MKNLLLRQLFFITVSYVGICLVCFALITSLDSTASQQLGFFTYLSGLFTGDLGISSVTSKDVFESFMGHLPASLELVILATGLAVLVGIPLGVLIARKHRSTTDTVINNLSIAAYSMPVFWWAIILIVYFSLGFKLTPVAGRLSFIYDIEPVTGFMLIDTLLSERSYRLEAFYDAIAHLILPVLTLATLPMAITIRVTRQAMLNVLNEDYIKTAQAKGLSEFNIYWHHGLRNALIPMTQTLSLQISTLMTGAMVVEYIFARPGIGKWLIDALTEADYMSLAGGVLITATMVIVINAIIELFVLAINPQAHTKVRVYHD